MAKPTEPTHKSSGPSKPFANATQEEDSDDYMNMTFQQPPSTKIETSIQRRARLQREAEHKSRPKSKAEQAAEEAAAREAALATSLDSSNKGFRMMQKLGFKGGALGKDVNDAEARIEPIALIMKEDRGGIGLDAEKKRKFREEVEGEAKRAKAEEGEYRERVTREREVKRLEGQVLGAMAVAERLDEEEDSNGNVDKAEQADDTHDAENSAGKAQPPKSKPLNTINVLWRARVKHRVEKERERRMRYDLHQSLSRLPTYEDPDEDAEDKQATSKEEEELEEEDPELDEFLSLEPEVRLKKLVEYLRERYHYCFWCKYRYPDAELDGCPGLTEDDHD